MSDPVNISCIERSKKGSSKNFAYSAKELNSQELSKFQYLGALFHTADSMAEGDFIDSIQAPWFFGVGVDELGFDYYAPVHLLSSPNWKIRMCTAWCLIGDAERKIARQLDYNEVHNFWPDFAFLDLGWDNEVMDWAAFLPWSLNVPVELKIARSVGQPLRDTLTFKA